MNVCRRTDDLRNVVVELLALPVSYSGDSVFDSYVMHFFITSR
jgi:23S rRNA maturation mini-RNase III